MKLTIFAAGSRGDIQPCVALGLGLQQAGYDIRLAAPADFAEFVHGHGIDFYPLRGDVQQIMAGDTGREFMESGGANPLKSIRAMRTMLDPVIAQMTEDALAACRDAEGLICLGVLSAFGQVLAEALHIPLIHVEPTPLLPTAAFAAPSWFIQKDLGGWHNRISGTLMLWVIWQWYRPFVNDFRARLKLPPARFRQFRQTLQSTPMLGAYSPHIIPHPSDWPDSVHVTGYFFLDSEPDWQPSPQLEAFLAAGEPPVYVGFGSMGGHNPDVLAEIVMDALARCNQRGILLTGWGGLRPEGHADHVFVLDSAPHRWLFPRMAAVVHHGGAGTTAEALRAGVPSLIVPFSFDQPFWGARTSKLGLGAGPIPQKRLSADRLADAIHTIVTDPDIKERAASCGAAIRAENGVQNAVDIVQRYWRISAT